MKTLNKSVKEKIENNKLVTLIIFMLCLLYIFNRHLIRPYIYENFNNSILIFSFGVLPNFLGTVIFYLFTKYFLNFKTAYITKYIIIYAIFHETINYALDNMKFDIYDILTTITTMILIMFLERINEN